MLKIKSIRKFAFIIPAMLGLIFAAYSPAVNESDQDKKEEKVISFDKTVHEFGTIKEANGEVSTNFVVTNNTDNTILLSNVRVSCGCSKTTWTKEPIEPGKTGKVTVIYDPKGQYGPFDKVVTVTTNGNPDRIVLHIKGTVE